MCAEVRKVRTTGRTLDGSAKKRRLTQELGIVLPTEDNIPPEDFSSYVTLWYGDKGVGKSSLIASYPDAITFMTEMRRRNLPIRQIPQQGEQPLTFKRMLDYQKLILDSGKYKTVNLDTADRTYQLCFDYVCKLEGIKNPSDKGGYEGAQVWGDIKRTFEDFVMGFIYAGLTVNFVSHAKYREVVTTSGDTTSMTVPTMSDACWTILKAITDFAFFYGYQANERYIQLRGTDRIWASCGTSEDHFLDPDGNKLLSILAGRSPQNAYESITRSFNNELTGDIYYDEGAEEEAEEAEDEEISLEPRRRKKKKKRLH